MDLIKRTKETLAEITDSGNILVTARLHDSYHDLTLEAEFSFPDLKVLSTKAEMNRIPHEDCLRGKNNLSRAVGVRVEKGLTQKSEALIAGCGGCVHLHQLFMECAHLAVAARYGRMRELISEMAPDITDIELLKLADETGAEIINSCEAYADYGNLIKEARLLESSPALEQLKSWFTHISSKADEPNQL